MNTPLPITLVPQPILRERAKKVTDFGPELQQLAESMVATMRHYRGIGLAASQVGQPVRLITIEYVPEEKGEPHIPLTILVNPTITDENRTTDWMDEGCLSIPGIELPVKRPTQINVLAQDLQGQRIKIRAKDLLARILQHEIDHTNGILIHERSFPRLKELAGKRVIFFGTPEHTQPYLTALAATEMEIVGVVTETDKPVGRKQVITPPPLKSHAQLLNLPVYQFSSLRNQEAVEQLKALKPDIAIVVAYGKIIPQNILDIPTHGFLNIHYALLPAYRGPSPHQTAILDGRKETGFTIFKLDAGLDTGPILVQKPVPIEPFDTSYTLIEKMIQPSIVALLEALPDYMAGNRKLKVQQDSSATTTRLFAKEDGRLDWTQETAQLDRQIRAMTPWPGAFTELNQERLIIHQAHVEGKLLVLDIVQPAGKSAMTWQDFCRGNREHWLTFFRETGRVKLEN